MNSSLPRRLFSLFLALMLVVTSIPPVYAAEDAEESTTVTTEATEPEQTTEATEPETSAETTEETTVETTTETTAETTTEATEPEETTVETTTEATESEETTEATEESTEGSEPTESSEATEPSESTEATEPSESTEATDPSETTEATEPEESTEATESEEEILPYGLAGLPEGYALDEKELAAKAEMITYDVLGTISAMTAGTEYAENEIMVMADTEEEAKIFAEAYCGELASYSHGTAMIALDTVTVAQAVEVAADPEVNLPAAYPNYIFVADPILEENLPMLSTFAEAPQVQTWDSWVNDNMDNPDTYLKDPASANYQWMHDAVDTYAAWGITTGDPSIKVAVIDTGVYVGHKDLPNVTHRNVGCGTGDPVGHGTHVAGIIGAAMDNGNGGAGIAPDVSILAYRTADNNGSMYTGTIIDAIYDAIAQDADIINMSLGSAGYNQSFAWAIQDAIAAGITVVASMGNDSTNAYRYPACYSGVIAAGSTDQAGYRSYFSNYGPWCDVTAPGSNIVSTYSNSATSYVSMSGTSMSSPVVAGVCALYMSAKGHVSPAAMEKALKSGTTKCSSSGMGAGIVNIAKMLGGKPAAPEYWLYNANTSDYIYSYAGETLDCESSLYLAPASDDDRDIVLYTINGKAPAVKKGQITRGQKYTSSINLSQYAGTTVTVKAMTVSGLGVPGKVLTLKLKVAKSTNINRISISGPDRLSAGKTGSFTATVYAKNSTYPIDQGVVWSISYSNIPGVSITQKGVLTTPARQTGVITVRATSKIDPSFYAEHSLPVLTISPVARMSLSYAKATVYIGNSLDLTVTMTDANGYSVDPEYSGVRWTSGNKKIATVDSNGRVTPIAKGKVTITCKALDGSNKIAKCVVTVKQQVTDITISGVDSIAPGGSATFKATSLPKSANNRNVVWSLEDAPAGVTINQKGRVTVKSYVPVNSYFYVKATAKDGQGAYDYFYVKVLKKCQAIYIRSDSGYNGEAAGIKYKSGTNNISGITLFSLDIPATSAVDNAIQLDGYVWADNSVYCTWSSSNPKVASVDAYGYVQAHKAGTAKITLKATDGSGKKATATVTVQNPVSSLAVHSSMPITDSGVSFIAFGKSATNKAVFTDTYGAPSNKKVSWSFTVTERTNGGDYVRTLSNTFRSSGLVKLSAAGKLTVKAGVKNYLQNSNGYFQIDVTATSRDGTGVSNTITYCAIPATTIIKYYDTQYLYDDYGRVTDSFMRFYTNQDSYKCNGAWQYPFSVTANKPHILGGNAYNKQTMFYDGTVLKNGKRYNVFSTPISTTNTGSRGKAKITITAADGTRKSGSVIYNIR